MTMKTRWANRAERRNAWADAAEAKAQAILDGIDGDRRSHDIAFNTQPGHIPARARMIAQTERAMDLMAKAAHHRAKADNLEAMATRNAGDAERARQAIRDAKTLQAGDRAHSIIYGPCEIVKVNAKTYRVRLDSGSIITEDKSRFR